MLTKRFASLPVLLGLFLLASAPAHAQSTAFEGSFVYVPQASQSIDKAIEKGVARMNFITRPVARGRLKKTNQPYQKLVIAHTPTEVRITTDDRAPITTPANGTPVRWTREDGEKFDVSTEWENGRLEQTFKADDGQRVNTFAISPDGNTLTMNVVVTSPRLPSPVMYDLVFRRQR